THPVSAFCWEAGASAPLSFLRCGRGRRIDHAANFGDLVRREAAAPGVLVNERLVLGKIDAKGFVSGDVAFDPLNVGAELLQGRVRLLRSLAQGSPFGAADCRQLALDDEFAHGSSLHKWRLIAIRLLPAGKVR